MSALDVDRICVVIGRTRHGMMQAEIQEAAKQGARFIELRLDFLKKAPDLKRLLANKPCPMLATVRRPPEGGKWSDSEDARLILLRQAIVGGFDWVDLETDVIDRVPRFGPVKRIVSYHNMREFPADIEKIHKKMCAQDADVVKIAVRAQQAVDTLRVLALVKNAPKPTVAFCMGDLGFPSRILGAKYGAPFTYAAFNKERNIAPGLPSINELRRVYHYDRIDANTQVFGIVGDPVGHSLSPLIHNMAFRKLGINAIYVPFRVPRDTLPDFLRQFDKIPVQGYSVTIPHKEAAAELADNKDETVEHTKAANTLVRFGNVLRASNTDYHGFLDTLKQFLPAFTQLPQPGTGSEPAMPAGLVNDLPQPAPTPMLETGSGNVSNRVVLVLGAGGVARAVVHALQREGALPVIANRTPDRAHSLAAEVGCRAIEWKARHSVLCDMVINCTSVGMHPNVDESPLHASFLKPGLIVFDTVYNPETTLLIKEARERSCHVITGVELFIRQAALQFQLFTGQPAPVDLLAKVVRRALSPVTLRDED